MKVLLNFCWLSDKGEKSTGEKRNLLYGMAKGKYVCSIDDDDWVPDTYIYEILKAVFLRS